MKIVAVLLMACAAALPGQKLAVEALSNPAGANAIQPNWSVTPDGGVLLSWIEPAKDGSSSLRYALRHGAQWSQPQTVVARRKFFRHPAEVPEVVQLGAQQWLARWIEQPDSASE